MMCNYVFICHEKWYCTLGHIYWYWHIYWYQLYGQRFVDTPPICPISYKNIIEVRHWNRARRSGTQSAFQFISKVFSVRARALWKAIHPILDKSCLRGPCFVHSLGSLVPLEGEYKATAWSDTLYNFVLPNLVQQFGEYIIYINI